MSEGGLVDLRSDTVTRPSEAMRAAMARAEVGDDVYGEDPTVRLLEQRAAELLGHEAALFVPTGTMGNQVAIQLLTTRGTDVLLEAGSHVYLYELGAMAAWSGVLPRTLAGRDGMLEPQQIAAAVAPPELYYMARASLLVLENSHNHAGGTVLEPERQERLLAAARTAGLRVHLDGARIFNAALALGLPARRLAAGFDTVMFCLSKGLGAPVGSILCGSVEAIAEARVLRKRMGGGMRQTGVLAAAGLHALDHHLERLSDDHRRASTLAAALARHPLFEIDPAAVRTNIVIAGVRGGGGTGEILRGLRDAGVLAGAMGPGRVRFVTHLDVDDTDLERALGAVAALRV